MSAPAADGSGRSALPEPEGGNAAAAAEVVPAEDPVDPADPEDPPRRDFLSLLTLSAAGIGAGAVCWPLVASLGPPAGQDIASAVPNTEFDLSALGVGGRATLSWNGLPVFVFRRGPDAVAALQDPGRDRLLLDPRSSERQQPPWATNWHRSLRPEIGVLVGICTHLGCVPRADPAAGGPDGLLCPCHGSRFDAAGRVLSGSPAQYNLPVPPYAIEGSNRLVIGGAPPGGGFDFDSIRRI